MAEAAFNAEEAELQEKRRHIISCTFEAIWSKMEFINSFEMGGGSVSAANLTATSVVIVTGKPNFKKDIFQHQIWQLLPYLILEVIHEVL